MAEFGMWLATIFGGVIGGAIGFLLIAFVAMVLAVPYLMMTRPPKTDADEEAVPSHRY